MRPKRCERELEHWGSCFFVEVVFVPTRTPVPAETEDLVRVGSSKVEKGRMHNVGDLSAHETVTTLVRKQDNPVSQKRRNIAASKK